MKFIKRKKLIRKSNKLINAKENTPLTALERKLMLYSIAEVDSDGKVIFRIQDLYGTSKLNTSHYRNVRKAVENLLNVKVIVEEGDVSDEDWSIKGMNVFDVIEASRAGGRIAAKFTQSMMPHIINLKRNYTTYLYDSVSLFRSDFSIRIYELLMQGIDRYGKREFDVEDLKHKLSLNNLKTYQNFNQLRTKVLDKACNEITEKSDINVSWEISKKVGKKVTAITFFMKRKEKEGDGEQLNVLKDSGNDKQLDALMALGFSEEQVRLILNMKKSPSSGPREEPIEEAEVVDEADTQAGGQQSLFGETKAADGELEAKQKRLVSRLKQLGLESPLIKKTLETTGASKESGIWKILYDLNIAMKDNTVKNPKAYLEKVLFQQYGIK
ncbi:replication initiation protein [Limibacter armeniacum]|uniref:replication initiation protein n=1 Tax=Limibacter armeniacum TaxID=466084 RepID=UPI002FE59EAD